MKLYWRIFIWLLIASLSTVLIASWVALPLWQEINSPAPNLQPWAQQAVDIYERNGKHGLQHWLRPSGQLRRGPPDKPPAHTPPEQQQTTTPAHSIQRPPFIALLLTANYQPLVTRSPLLRLEPQVLGGWTTQLLQKKLKRGTLYATPIRGQQGHYWFVGFKLQPQVRHMPMYIRLAIALPLLALAALLISLQISRPIRQLQHSAKQFAAGALQHKTPKKLANRGDELGQLAREFDDMALQIQQQFENQKRLLSDVSHELRSPLARLEVALELARQAPPQQNAAYLDRIQLESQRLNALLSQTLTLAKLENNAALPRQTCNVAAMTQTLCADANFEVSHQAGRRHVQVHYLGPNTAQLLANEALLHSAVENILRNAVKYTADHSVVQVCLTTTTTAITISITDQGPGIAEDLKTELLRPFVRASHARERESGGYGLGLAIAQSACQAHEGHLQLLSPKAGGLQVVITLPIGPLPAARI